MLPGHHESIGTILSFTYHQNLSYFGLKDYNAKQLSGYANILYSNRYGKSERHKFTAGGSFQVDILNENMLHITDDISRIKSEYIEMVPGIFTEYSYSIDEKFV